MQRRRYTRHPRAGRRWQTGPSSVSSGIAAGSAAHCGAEGWADLAVTLAWRLPATRGALARGWIDLYRARLIAEATAVLSQDAARAVEEQILPRAGQMTSAQLRVRLRRAPSRPPTDPRPGSASTSSRAT